MGRTFSYLADGETKPEVYTVISEPCLDEDLHQKFVYVLWFDGEIARIPADVVGDRHDTEFSIWDEC